MSFSQDHFILIVVILGLLFWWIFRVRPGEGQQKAPKLNLKSSGRLDQFGRGAQTMDPLTRQAEAIHNGRARVLDVVFMYNGHNFEAHEVLGVPLGASTERIEKAYQEMQGKMQVHDCDLIDTAYRVLKSR